MTYKIKKVGSRVTLTRQKSINHFRNAPFGAMPITGEIIKIDINHMEGTHFRECLVKFDDGRESWRSYNEIAVI